jgi:general secretion pathway protein K
MSLITIGIVGAAHTAAGSASRELVRTQAQAAVESGIDYAISELLTSDTLVPALLNKAESIEIGGFRVEVSVRPEDAKVDLNYADANLLRFLFVSGGADNARAERLAAAVEDWRDGDDFVHVNGAERRQYSEAGLKYGPANQFFRSTDELRLVLGMDWRLFECLRGEVTIYSQRQGIRIDFASPAFRRAAGVGRDALTSPSPIKPGDVFEITARLNDVKRGVKRSERAIVRVTGNPADPYALLAFEPARPIEEAAARSCPKVLAADNR